MYCLKITIQPTAAMTFRVLPGSILNITTYPFVPPTTLSGFLRRLGMLSVGLELPETRINKEKPPIYMLPPRYISLGAYVEQGSWSGVHRTKRKGMREFSHTSFSKIYQEKDKFNFQLHTWEYLISGMMTGYVISAFSEGLDYFQKLVGYGCKLGKEGFAFISEVSEVFELEAATLDAVPSTVVPMEALLQANAITSGYDIYSLYRYKQNAENSSMTAEDGFLDDSSSDLAGFIPFVIAHFSQEQDTPTEMDYYTNYEDIYIPTSLVSMLKGDSDD